MKKFIVSFILLLYPIAVYAGILKDTETFYIARAVKLGRSKANLTDGTASWQSSSNEVALNNCSAGQEYDSAKNTCKDCDAGYYSTSGKTCKKCETAHGTCPTCKPETGKCLTVSCEVGYIKYQEKSSSPIAYPLKTADGGSQSYPGCKPCRISNGHCKSCSFDGTDGCKGDLVCDAGYRSVNSGNGIYKCYDQITGGYCSSGTGSDGKNCLKGTAVCDTNYQRHGTPGYQFCSTNQKCEDGYGKSFADDVCHFCSELGAIRKADSTGLYWCLEEIKYNGKTSGYCKAYASIDDSEGGYCKNATGAFHSCETGYKQGNVKDASGKLLGYKCYPSITGGYCLGNTNGDECARDVTAVCDSKYYKHVTPGNEQYCSTNNCDSSYVSNDGTCVYCSDSKGKTVTYNGAKRCGEAITGGICLDGYAAATGATSKKCVNGTAVCNSGYLKYTDGSDQWCRSGSTCYTGYTKKNGVCVKEITPVTGLTGTCPNNLQDCGSTGCCPTGNSCSYYKQQAASGGYMCFQKSTDKVLAE